VTPFLPVRDVMSPDPVRIDGFATVQDALALMRERAISALVVERRDARDEYGMLLVADIAREVIGRNRPVARTDVYEIMAKPAPAVDADMDIRYAIRHLARFDLTHAIVLHQRELVGLVTLREMTIRFIELGTPVAQEKQDRRGDEDRRARCDDDAEYHRDGEAGTAGPPQIAIGSMASAVVAEVKTQRASTWLMLLSIMPPVAASPCRGADSRASGRRPRPCRSPSSR
jgi:CBS domain-containing protein